MMAGDGVSAVGGMAVDPKTREPQRTTQASRADERGRDA